MQLSSRTLTTFLLPFGTALAACAGGAGGGPDEPVPATNFCSDDNVTTTCQADAAKAGFYPAADTVADGLITPTTGMGCGYALSLDGHILYTGRTGIHGNGAWGLDDLAPVASVSKTMTALAVMRLIDLGEIPSDLTQVTVGDVLPEAPEALADLTLHQLLAHTSGLTWPNYNMAYFDPAVTSEIMPELDKPGLMPRAMWYAMKDVNVPTSTTVDEANGIADYSSAGYRILGSVVDAHTLMSPEDFLDEGPGGPVGDPMAMNRDQLTKFYLGGYEAFIRDLVAGEKLLPQERMVSACLSEQGRIAGLDHYVRGYVALSTGGHVPSTDTSTSRLQGAHGPAGGWMMTVGDLARLGNGIVTRRFVSEARLQQMTTEVASDLGWDFGYGVGLLPITFADDVDGPGIEHKGYGHGGDYKDLGHHAMWRVVELPGGRSIGGAMICVGGINMDNNGFNSGNLRTALRTMMRQVYTDFIANPPATSPITYVPALADCDAAPLTPPKALDYEFGDSIKQSWAGLLYQAGNDLARAETLVRRRVSAEPEGAQILRAWDVGDVTAAAELGLDMMRRRLAESEQGDVTGGDPTGATGGDPTGGDPTGGTARR
ncbi:MAG: serine hydrolase [Deltaproteobacteria bacterium]|nr:serine hydrolase [Deltaproteobacteria bacterium]